MSVPRLFLVAVMFAAFGGRSLRAQAPLPPFELALTVNDGTAKTVHRGWPLLLIGEAVLMDDISTPVALDLPSLTLAIAPVQGPAQRWPLRRVTQFSSAPILGSANETVEVVWLLAAEDAATLVPGAYTARLSWAGRTSPTTTFTVTDAPATLSPHDDARRALLQSRAALSLGDTAGAMAALTPAATRQPDSIALLVQRARVHLQRNEPAEALQATQRALAAFSREHPNASHPPVSILEVDGQAKSELLKGAVPGPPQPGSQGGAPRTVSTPNSQVAPSVSTSVPINSSATRAAAATNSGPSQPSRVVGTAGEAGAGMVVSAAELVDAKIRVDAAGQWATSATAGSQYDRTTYSAAKATGAPDVPVAGNSPDAWCPASKDKGSDWLEVTFAKPVYAVEVRARQNDAAGAISRIEAIEPDGTAHLWWEGVDPYKAPAVREIVWFAVRLSKTPYLVARVKFTLNLASGPGWKEIDAVQLVGAGP